MVIDLLSACRFLCYYLAWCFYGHVKRYSAKADCFKGAVLCVCVEYVNLCRPFSLKVSESVKHINDSSLQGERKILVLFGISLLLTLHVAGLYWWYWNDELWYPLVMIPPKAIPPFWNAIFIIVVNGAFFIEAF